LPEFHLLMFKSILFLVLFSFRAFGGRLIAKNEHFFCTFFLIKKYRRIKKEKIYSTFLSFALR